MEVKFHVSQVRHLLETSDSVALRSHYAKEKVFGTHWIIFVNPRPEATAILTKDLEHL
jgi:hypothetical protein